MGIVELILIGVGLAMDAFAVSICKGLSMKKKINYKKALIVALYFGLFQGGMPLIGYALGVSFEEIVLSIDHWIAFILLSVIGIGMIKESLGDEEESLNDKVDFKTMIILAIATSIDALAIGVTFAFLNVNIIFASLLICVITFVISYFGVVFGNKFGDKFGSKAELVGGIILILMGLKILLEHLEILL